MSTSKNRYRPDNDIFVFEAIPMKHVNTKPITPFLPVRTRDGRRAYVMEYDPTSKPFGIKMKYDNGTVSDTGANLMPGTATTKGWWNTDGQKAPHRHDLFNVSVHAWNKAMRRAKELQQQKKETDNASSEGQGPAG